MTENQMRLWVADLLSQFSGQRNTLTIPRAYIDFTGDLTSALLLSQIVYWSDRTRDSEGWFAKSYNEWHDELTMSEYQVRAATKSLAAFGVETKLKKFDGAPTVHYRLNKSKFSEFILKKLQNGNLKNLRNQDTEKTSVSITEPTEPTTENISRGDWYDAIKSVWGYEAGRNGDTSNWLSGKKLKAQYKDYPIEPPLTPDELITWSKDWRNNHPGIDMVQSPAKVQDSIIKWRHEQHERLNPKMSRTRELMEAQHKFQREQFGIGAPYDEPIKL